MSLWNHRHKGETTVTTKTQQMTSVCSVHVYLFVVPASSHLSDERAIAQPLGQMWEGGCTPRPPSSQWPWNPAVSILTTGANCAAFLLCWMTNSNTEMSHQSTAHTLTLKGEASQPAWYVKWLISQFREKIHSKTLQLTMNYYENVITSGMIKKKSNCSILHTSSSRKAIFVHICIYSICRVSKQHTEKVDNLIYPNGNGI